MTERRDWPGKLGQAWPAAAFVLLLAVHVLLATRNLESGFLAGHEFRQTQTAISAHFIREEWNFSLAYPTPVLGKPWSVPMEFPLYQWGVALLTEATGWPIHLSGRVISLAAFYLVLPALWLLLAEAGIVRRARWLCLGLVVTAPVQIYYARAVLIESLALAFAVWFLFAFCRGMRTQSKTWLLLAALCGTGAALVKVTTAMVWLSAAGVIALVLAWRSARDSGRHAAAVLTRAAATVVLPVGAALWWVNYSDRIKALSPGGRDLRAEVLTGFNFGRVGDRLDPEVLGALLANWQQAITPLWAMLPVIAAAFWLERRRGWLIAAGLGMCAAALLTFIQLYRWHDYYFFAVACSGLVATGLALAAIESRDRLRWVGLTAFALVCAAQLHSYATHYAGLQNTRSNGGSGLTNLLRDVTPRDSVILVIGRDWSAVLPYYAQRRALMLTDNRLDDLAYLDAAAANLAGEDVSALVIGGPHRGDEALRRRLGARFGIAAEMAFSDPEFDVYAGQRHHDMICRHLDRYRLYDRLVLRGRPAPVAEPKPQHPLVADNRIHSLTEAQADEHFFQVSPRPHRYSCQFGFGQNHVDNIPVLGAHPDSALWIRIPVGATRLTAGFGLPRGSHEDSAESTDGVRFSISWLQPDGSEQVLLQRELRPATEPADRGPQEVELRLPEAIVGEVVLRTHPIGHLTRDWAYWTRVEIR